MPFKKHRAKARGVVQSLALTLAYVRSFTIFPTLKTKSQVSLASAVPRPILRYGVLNTQKLLTRTVAHTAYVSLCDSK